MWYFYCPFHRTFTLCLSGSFLSPLEVNRNTISTALMSWESHSVGCILWLPQTSLPVDILSLWNSLVPTIHLCQKEQCYQLFLQWKIIRTIICFLAVGCTCPSSEEIQLWIRKISFHLPSLFSVCRIHGTPMHQMSYFTWEVGIVPSSYLLQM